MELGANCYFSYFVPDGQGNYYLIYEEYIEEGIDPFAAAAGKQYHHTAYQQIKIPSLHSSLPFSHKP